jgi:hypothetical protein
MDATAVANSPSHNFTGSVVKATDTSRRKARRCKFSNRARMFPDRISCNALWPRGRLAPAVHGVRPIYVGIQARAARIISAGGEDKGYFA